jgi:hypothetical protein
MARSEVASGTFKEIKRVAGGTNFTFVAPANTNQVYVVLNAGGGGGGGRNNYPPGYPGTAGGNGASVGAYVKVSPGSSYAVVAGAGGAAGGVSNNGGEGPGSGATGGSSSFDGNTLVATGGNGGGRGGQHTAGQSNANPAGNAGTVNYATTLEAGAPSGAVLRVGSVVSNNSGGTGGNDSSAGTAGSVQIYSVY